MPPVDPHTLQVPEVLARAIDLDPRAVLAVLGRAEAPTGYLLSLPEVEPHRLLQIWRHALARAAPAGFRPVVYEPIREPGARDRLRDEPSALETALGMPITVSAAARADEPFMPVHRSADVTAASIIGRSEIERTLVSPRDDVDPDALVDLGVPAEDLIQLPAGPTAQVDFVVRAEKAEGAASADRFMAYVLAADPAEALARIYLDGRRGSGGSNETLDILRDWHRRYGAELLQVKAEAGTIELCVERFPESTEECVRLGREAQDFWPPLVRLWQGGDNAGHVGRRLAGSRVWRFES